MKKDYKTILTLEISSKGEMYLKDKNNKIIEPKPSNAILKYATREDLIQLIGQYKILLLAEKYMGRWKHFKIALGLR